jgi:hypothetical protein
MLRNLDSQSSQLSAFNSGLLGLGGANRTPKPL